MPEQISEYIVGLGKQVKHKQKLLSYYDELFEFYNDKLPDNKYMYYLDENPYLAPVSTHQPETLLFFETTGLDLSLLATSIRIFKLFPKTGKRVEFPFENKTDFHSFTDPLKYINQHSSFASERFAGPIVGLDSLDIFFTGQDGKGADIATKDWVTVNLKMEFQDVKMLFKQLHQKENIQYKDLFGQPNGAYQIVMEIGYSIPDGFAKLNPLARRKLNLLLQPNAGKTKITYKENGAASLSTTFTGHSETESQKINLLSSKYYEQLLKNQNMLLIDNKSEYSEDALTKKIQQLRDVKNPAPTPSPEKQTGDAPHNPKRPLETTTGKSQGGAVESTATKTREEIENEVKDLRRKVQLAKAVGSAPPVFPFIAALYELGQIYYFELDNEQYKRYIKKIAGGIPVDVSDIKVVPKRKKKLKTTPADIIKKIKSKPANNEYSAGSLMIKHFDAQEAEEEEDPPEKIKFFYFGDLLNAILNNKKGTGIGQDLDKLGKSNYKLLLGPAVFVRDENLKKIYNIANVPISLDMFLFELNKVIINRGLKQLNLKYFLSDFMKKFFDISVLAAEKQKTGKDQQYYDGKMVYTLDQSTIDRQGKFLTSISDHVASSDTTKLQDFVVIRTILNDKKLSKNNKNNKFIPKIFLGGPDRGPLKNISFEVIAVPGMPGVTIVQEYEANKGTDETIGNVGDDSILITSKTKATMSLKGNPYLNIGDLVIVDTRFVDGGLFNEEPNLIFFSGYFSIFKVEHKIKGNQWETSYGMGWQTPFTTPTFKALGKAAPETQTEALHKEVKETSTSKGPELKGEASKNPKRPLEQQAAAPEKSTITDSNTSALSPSTMPAPVSPPTSKIAPAGEQRLPRLGPSGGKDK